MIGMDRVIELEEIDIQPVVVQQPRFQISRPRVQIPRNHLITQSQLTNSHYFKEDLKLSSPSPITSKDAKPLQLLNNIFPIKIPISQIPDGIDKDLEAFSKFNLKVFLESFIYHVLVFYILGPFMPLFMLALSPSTHLHKNMMFIPGFDKLTFLQLSVWLSNVSLLYLHFSSEKVDEFSSEILFTQMFLLSRCIIIAARYASFSPRKMELYRTKDLRDDQITREFYTEEWPQQTSRIIYNEISCSIERHEIDKQLFFIQFLVDPKQETAERLVQHNLDLSVFHNNFTEFEPQSLFFKDTDSRFFGYSIITEFVEIFKRRTKNFQLRIKYFAFFFCILNVLIPITQRYFEDKLHWGVNCAILIPEGFLILFNGYIVVTYNLTGIVDLLRKLFLLSQCANLIAAQKKLEISDIKTLPTVNIFCPANIKAWSILKKICFEYGFNYFQRAQILFRVQMSIILVGVVVFILKLFKIIKLDDTFLQLFFLSFTYTFFVSMFVLYFSSRINGYFDNFSNLLIEDKLVISQLTRMKDFYFDQGLVPRSYLQYRGVNQIQAYVQKSKASVDTILQDLKESYSEALESLNVQRQFPFTLMGIEINNGVFSSYVITVGSIFATIIGQFIGNLAKFDI